MTCFIDNYILLDKVFIFFFLLPYLWHMEVPRLGFQLELQLPAYTTATPDPSCICDPRHSLQQHRILSPLGEATDRTHILTAEPQWELLLEKVLTAQEKRGMAHNHMGYFRQNYPASLSHFSV